MLEDLTDYAREAYEAYRNHTGGISLATGQSIPEWDQLRPDIQAARKASTVPLVAKLEKSEGERDHFREMAYSFRAERDTLRARVAELEAVLVRLREAAEKIRHWHDWGTQNEGMVVSAESVRGLWDASDETMAPSPAKPEGRDDE